ncbi:MAG: hypothetical protein K2R98_22385 [Gemmataceae bacterium]|nr:hypothetical protein [Gemmataceae bacterium]
MPGPVDNTLKHLTELSAPDWVVRGGWSPAPATLIDADIATISGASDKVIRVTGPPDWLLAVDFQTGHDAVAKLADLLLYNSALFKRHRLRVRSLLVLVHPGADSPQLTGLYERGFPNEAFDVALRYRVVRVWQVPPSQWLSGGLGLLPLALLGDAEPTQLPTIVAEMKQRLDQSPSSQARDLWSAAYLLMGLRYESALIHSLLQGIPAMRESTTYQAILQEGKAEGKAEEARNILRLLGHHKFGEPPAEVQSVLDGVNDLHRLEELTVRVIHAASWQELLGLTGPR